MQDYFTENVEENLESVCLIWGPLKTGFTVKVSRWQIKNLTNSEDKFYKPRPQ